VKYASIRDGLAGACAVRMACRLLEVGRLTVEDTVARIHRESS
jgi:hypothetical protein